MFQSVLPMRGVTSSRTVACSDGLASVSQGPKRRVDGSRVVRPCRCLCRPGLLKSLLEFGIIDIISRRTSQVAEGKYHALPIALFRRYSRFSVPMMAVNPPSKPIIRSQSRAGAASQLLSETYTRYLSLCWNGGKCRLSSCQRCCVVINLELLGWR